MNNDEFKELFNVFTQPAATRAERIENYENVQMIIQIAEFMKGNTNSPAAAPALVELARADMDKEHKRLWTRAKVLLEKAEDNETSTEERTRIAAELEPIIQRLAKYDRAIKELQ